MNFFLVHIVAEFADLLTTALIHFVWQGVVLTLMLLIIVKMLDARTARLRYLLSVGTLLMMGIAPILTIAMHRNGTSALKTSGEASENSTTATAAGIDAEESQVSATLRNPEIKVCVLMAWLAGVLILSTRLAIGFGVTLWIRANLEPLSEQFEQRVRILGDRLSVDARQRVFTCVRIGQAVAIGFLRPIVLIPEAWLTELTPEILEAVIAHELAHIRRWDLWVNLVQRIIETLLFYHPAVWWLSSRIRLEREMCCDEIAAGCLDRAVYARSLESVARIAHDNLLMATSIQGGMKMKLLSRIRYLFGAAPADSAANWWAAGFVAMTVPFVAAVAFSLTAGSAPSATMAEEGKSAEVEEANVEVGDGIVIKMSGDLAKEFYRLMEPSKQIKPGFVMDVIGKITQVFPDGRFKIEYTFPVDRDGKAADRDGKAAQQLSLAAFAQRSQVKMYPKPKKDSRIVASVDNKPIEAKIVVGKSNQNAEDLAPDKNNVHTVYFTTFSRNYVELSDLKGVQMKLWELKDQVGE